MRTLHPLLGQLAFLWAIGGCSMASAADGSVPTPRGTLTAKGTSNPLPSSHPADASPRHRPPQEAFDACKSLSEGAACSVTFQDRTMNGTCRKGPRGESELACVPERAPGPPPADSNRTLTDTALERELDRLEREIRGS